MMEEYFDLFLRFMEVVVIVLFFNDEEYVYEDVWSEECSEVEDVD